MEKKSIFEQSASLESLKEIANKVCNEIKELQTFCLWLDGPMGAGKTTLTRYIMRGLGLSEDIPVTSPTYTYLNEYKIGTRWIAHLDLYRLEGSGDLNDLGLTDTRPFSGYIVEWPEAVEDPDPLHATHILEIKATEPSLRQYRFSRIG